jgi:rSAM/selenodomain-associated transferase 2
MRLDIIIPTLNEEGYIGPTIEKVYARAADIDNMSVWVSDCASSDGTLKEAGKYPVHIPNYETSPTSRATAMNFAAERSFGDVLMFLHADTTVPKHFDQLIWKTLSKPGTVGGAFNVAFDDSCLALRLASLINSVRYHLIPRYFGDQAIFVTRSAFMKVGKFPDVRIMEDTIFCKRLWKIGRLRLVKEKVTISPRRFKEWGILNTFMFDARCTILDLFNLSSEKYSHLYQEYNRIRGDKANLRS